VVDNIIERILCCGRLTISTVTETNHCYTNMRFERDLFYCPEYKGLKIKILESTIFQLFYLSVKGSLFERKI
jgi:hypothetical protein